MSAKVATGPRNYHSVQDVTAVNDFVDFYHLIDGNKRGVGHTGGANSGPNHYGLWIYAFLDDTRCAMQSLGAPVPVVLMIVCVFDGE